MEVGALVLLDDGGLAGIEPQVRDAVLGALERQAERAVELRGDGRELHGRDPISPPPGVSAAGGGPTSG